MNWSIVGKLIGPLAPAAGSILGGLIPFPGASLIGQKLGELIAGQFGVPPTPQAVSEAIATAGEETARAKINAAVEQARVQVQGYVDIEKAYQHTIEVGLVETGQTMRAELDHEHWFFTGWRPASGWIFDIYATLFGGILIVAAFREMAASPTPLKVISDAWPLFAAYFGSLAAMVGVYIVGRSQEKVATAVLPVPALTKPPVKK